MASKHSPRKRTPISARVGEPFILPTLSPPVVGIACDASCFGGKGSKSRDGYFHGKCEWQAIDLSTGELVFRSHLQDRSTINIAEFIAIVDCLKWLSKMDDEKTPVYSDSKIAIEWVRGRRTSTSLPLNTHTMHAIGDLENALGWLKTINPKNPVLWWKSYEFGPMPADFNRK
jgi:ribonuclease HI